MIHSYIHFFFRDPFSIYGLYHSRKYILDARPGLDTTGKNLVRRQDKPIGTGISQLGGEAILDLAHVICVIDAAAGSLVDGRANGASRESCAVDGFNSGSSATSEGYKFGVIGSASSARITIGCWRVWLVFLVEI